MATRIRIVLNESGIRDLLRSQMAVDEVHRRAQRIADAAGEGFEVETEVGSHRARSIVITATAEAMVAEASERRLTRAIDAGRS